MEKRALCACGCVIVYPCERGANQWRRKHLPCSTHRALLLGPSVKKYTGKIFGSTDEVVPSVVSPQGMVHDNRQ